MARNSFLSTSRASRILLYTSALSRTLATGTHCMSCANGGVVVGCSSLIAFLRCSIDHNTELVALFELIWDVGRCELASSYGRLRGLGLDETAGSKII
jgi:hypothetical protein